MITELWEQLDENTQRMKVPGGWLVRCTDQKFKGFYNGKNMQATVVSPPVFVPDMMHKWEAADSYV